MRPAHDAPTPALGIRPGTRRGTAGFFNVARQADGRWTLLDPAEEPFFCKAVHGVTQAQLPGDAGWPRDSAARLRGWGFNALGAGDDGSVRPDGLPYLATVDFCRAGPPIVAPGLRLPDVFAGDWPALAAAWAQTTCAPLTDTPELLGWVTDDTISWAGRPGGGRPSLLQICLSLEPTFAAYHAAWEFVLALHRGSLDAVARAWGVVLNNKETVRTMTRAEHGIATRGYARDDARWSREFAQRYFATTSAAIRAVDPHHLLFGCRFEAGGGAASAAAPGPQVVAACTYPAVDVTLRNWNELPTNDAAGAQPVLADDVCWVDETGARAVAKRRQPRLTTLERMLRRGRTGLERMARHPAVVGYVWSRWQDEPGEQPPFARGLVHVNGNEAREHTELLASFNARAETVRA